MSVLRFLRVLLPLAIVVAAVAAVLSVVSARPDLQDAKRGVDRAWPPLQAQLQPHYSLLSQADAHLQTVTGPVRTLADQVKDGLARWQSAVESGDVAAQVRAANSLEALSRRLVATARTSPRATGDAGSALAVAAFANGAATVAQGGAVDTFNKAVTAYQKQRRGPVRSVVATMLGDRDIPAFSPAPPVAA